jgi:hypothetical protein
MQLTHTFSVAQPPEVVWDRLFAAPRYLANFSKHRGLIGADAAWPAQGARLALRFALLPGVSLTLHQLVTRRDDIQIDVLETALGGFWRDAFRWRVEPSAGGSAVTMATSPALRYRVLQPLIWLSWPVYRAVVLGAARRLPEFVAAGAAPVPVAP